MRNVIFLVHTHPTNKESAKTKCNKHIPVSRKKGLQKSLDGPGPMVKSIVASKTIVV